MKNYIKVIIENYHSPEEFYIREDLLEIDDRQDKIVKFMDKKIEKIINDQMAFDKVQIKDVFATKRTSFCHEGNQKLFKFRRNGHFWYAIDENNNTQYEYPN